MGKETKNEQMPMHAATHPIDSIQKSTKYQDPKPAEPGCWLVLAGQGLGFSVCVCVSLSTSLSPKGGSRNFDVLRRPAHPQAIELFWPGEREGKICIWKYLLTAFIFSSPFLNSLSLSLSLSRHFTLMIEQYPYTLSLAGLSIESAK